MRDLDLLFLKNMYPTKILAREILIRYVLLRDKPQKSGLFESAFFNYYFLIFLTVF